MGSLKINHDTSMPPQAAPIHLEAETMKTHPTGEKDDHAWDLWSDGYVADTITLKQAGNYRIDVRARGLLGGAYAPKLAVLIFGHLVDYANVTTADFQTYSFQTDNLGSLAAGKHELKLAFTNHFRSADADGKNVVRRNLILDAVEITPRNSIVQPKSVLANSDQSLRELAKSRGLLFGAAVRDEAFYGKHKDEYRTQLEGYASLMVAENAFKPRRIARKEGVFDFTVPDDFATFAAENSMVLRGHTLVWHESVPAWLEAKTLSREEAMTWLCARTRSANYRTRCSAKTSCHKNQAC